MSIYSGIPLISQPWRHIGVTYSKRPWYSVYPKIPTLLFHHHRVSKSFYISHAGSYIYQYNTLQTHFGMHRIVISKKKSWNQNWKIIFASFIVNPNLILHIIHFKKYKKFMNSKPAQISVHVFEKNSSPPDFYKMTLIECQRISVW